MPGSAPLPRSEWPIGGKEIGGTRLILNLSVRSRDVLKTCRKVVLKLSIFYENNKSRTGLRETGPEHECSFFTHEWIFVLITQFGAVEISKVQP